jgi:hypothetical protein
VALGRDASEVAGLELGRAKMEKREGKGVAGWPGQGFQLGFGTLSNRN